MGTPSVNGPLPVEVKGSEEAETIFTPGERLVCERAVRASGDGYLNIAPGDTVEILHVGDKENPEERGWLFAERLNETRGWIPTNSFEKLPAYPPSRLPPCPPEVTTDEQTGRSTVSWKLPKAPDLGRLFHKKTLRFDRRHMAVEWNPNEDNRIWLALTVKRVERDGPQKYGLFNVEKLNAHITLYYLTKKYLPHMEEVVAEVEKTLDAIHDTGGDCLVGDFKLNEELVFPDGNYCCLDVLVQSQLHDHLHRIAKSVERVGPRSAYVPYKQSYHLSIANHSDATVTMEVF